MTRGSPPQGSSTTGQKFGVSNQTGNGSTTSFTIAHNLGSTPTAAIVTPGSTATTGFWVSALSSSNITVTFSAAPANAASLVFYWMVLK